MKIGAYRKVRIIINILTSPGFFFVIGSTVFLFSQSKSNSYVNIPEIFSNYIKFINKNPRAVSFLIIVPFFIAQGVNLVTVIGDGSQEILTLSVSILITFFFSYFEFFSAIKIESEHSIKQKIILKTLKEESRNISLYQMLLCVFLLILCFVYPTFSEKNTVFHDFKNGVVISTKTIISFFMYYFFIRIIFNFFVLIKRRTAINQNDL